MTVRVGANNAVSGGQMVNVTKFIMHPQFSIDYPYDIALLKTTVPLNLGKTAKAVNLPDASPAAGTQGQVTGFGKTEVRNPVIITDSEVVVFAAEG